MRIGSFTGTLIIYNHPAVEYAWSPALKVHAVNNPRLTSVTLSQDLSLFMPAFNQAMEAALRSDTSIITLPYTPLITKVIQVFLHKYFGSYLENWLQVAFLHDTADTLALPGVDTPLEYKRILLDDIAQYPAIKPVYIPRSLLITRSILHNLLAQITPGRGGLARTL